MEEIKRIKSYNSNDIGFLPGIIDIFRDNYFRLARFLIENNFSEDFEQDTAMGTFRHKETKQIGPSTQLRYFWA